MVLNQRDFTKQAMRTTRDPEQRISCIIVLTIDRMCNKTKDGQPFVRAISDGDEVSSEKEAPGGRERGKWLP